MTDDYAAMLLGLSANHGNYLAPRNKRADAMAYLRARNSYCLSQSFVWIGSATHSTSDAFRQRQRERIRIATLARDKRQSGESPVRDTGPIEGEGRRASPLPNGAVYVRDLAEASRNDPKRTDAMARAAERIRRMQDYGVGAEIAARQCAQANPTATLAEDGSRRGPPGQCKSDPAPPIRRMQNNDAGFTLSDKQYDHFYQTMTNPEPPTPAMMKAADDIDRMLQRTKRYHEIAKELGIGPGCSVEDHNRIMQILNAPAKPHSPFARKEGK